MQTGLCLKINAVDCCDFCVAFGFYMAKTNPENLL